MTQSVQVQENHALAPLTTWRIGGSARFFIELASSRDIEECHEFAQSRSLPLLLLGRGSNLLVPDGTIDAVVVSTRQAAACSITDEMVIAEGGMFLPNLSRLTRKAGLAGFGFAIGIPGTVGAGVAINAGIGGIPGPCMGDVVVNAKVFDFKTNTIVEMDRQQLGLRYRGSDVLHHGFVMSTTMRSTGKAQPEDLAIEEKAYLRDRKKRQPLNDRSCGSVFKPTASGTAAGVLIEQAGLKGTRRGDAMVSEKHANWILNEGNATAADTKALIEEIQHRVLEHSGEVLEREVVFLPDDLA